MTEERKAPSIRFKKFSGQNAEAWEQRKLGEVVEVNSGKDYKHLSTGTIPVYGTGGYMLSVSESLSDVDGIGIGRKGTIDKPYILKAPFWTVDTLFYCIPKDANNLYFVYSVFNNVTWKNLDESTGVPSLSKIAINNIQSFFPTPPEQRAIGSFFQELNHLITLQQRKLEKSRRIKKAMLQKMFPENKQTVPAIRFKEFSGQNAEAWEQRKLEECTEISAGGDIDKSKLLNKGKYPVIANALTNDGIIGYYNDSYRIEAPAVTVTGRGNVGVAKARNVSFTPVVRLLSLKSEYDVIFLENAINIQNIVIESTGVPQLTVPQLGSYKIFFPTPPEQRDIGSFFQDLDKFIALQQRRLDKLLNLKKALLEQMMM
ncbi:restriction endonuclease subunit S [Streptococcus cristatus]|uniref:Putative type-1 restriction enzyme specificity protein n=1 Tax=Streptococcus cristatus TaxID=45634 RepID=A0A428GM75_STRCR|nr:restriction endonuclease subunit S [Streptococcus cristatus]RSJ82072.1 putative type-1 restriction enzyme specificity protein [Streptococcus cristatus]